MLHSRSPLTIRALRRARSFETAALGNFRRTGGDVEAGDRTLEHLQCYYWLVEGYFVAGLVDACEGEVCALLDLSVHDGVGGADVGVAGACPAGWVDFVVYDCFVADPVAYAELLVGFCRCWVRDTYRCSPIKQRERWSANVYDEVLPIGIRTASPLYCTI